MTQSDQIQRRAGFVQSLKNVPRIAEALVRMRRRVDEPLPEERIMMFHPARAGSTVLGKMMDQHPDVSWQGEAILQFFEDLGVRRLRVPPERILLDRMGWIEEKFVGFEVQYYQIFLHLGINLREFLKSLDRLNFRHFVILSRRNILRAVVSNLVARERNQWEFNTKERVDLTRIRVNVDRIYDPHPKSALLKVLELHEEHRKRIKELLPDYLELVYEDDVEQDPYVGYRRLCGHFGIEPVDVSITTRRATPYPLSEIIENFDDVRAKVDGTRFEWMLEG